MSKHFARIPRKVLNDPRLGLLSPWIWRTALELWLLCDDQGQLPTDEIITWKIHRTANTWIEARDKLINAGLIQGTVFVPARQAYEARQAWRDVYGSEWPLTRLQILERDSYTCQYCGDEANHVDHIVPISRGGTNDPENLVASCSSCNHRKGNRTPEEAGMEL
jgi:hypothetical protein